MPEVIELFTAVVGSHRDAMPGRDTVQTLARGPGFAALHGGMDTVESARREAYQSFREDHPEITEVCPDALL